MAKHRVALIGMFSSVAGARSSIPASCELVGLCDIKDALLEKCRAEDDSILITNDFREIAKMPNCDTVVAWTPNHTHRDIAVACLENGKHVFIEKPMGTTVQEGREIVEAERKSGKYVGVDLEYRWGKLAQWIKQILDSGEIGTVKHFEFDHHRGGWLHDSTGGQYRTKRSVSGMMRMEGIHYLDLMRYWFGEMSEIKCFGLPNTLPHYEFHDNVTLIMKFQNGCMGRYTTSHNKVGYFFGNNDKGPDLGHSSKWAICGEKGLIRIDDWAHRADIYHYTAQPAGTNSLKAEFVRSIGWSLMDNPFSMAHDIAGHRRDFMQRMSEGKPPFQRAADIHISERISFAVDEAIGPDGKVVDCTNI